MHVSYKKLWKMLIDLDMSKTELIQKSKNHNKCNGAYGKK